MCNTFFYFLFLYRHECLNINVMAQHIIQVQKDAHVPQTVHKNVSAFVARIVFIPLRRLQ